MNTIILTLIVIGLIIVVSVAGYLVYIGLKILKWINNILNVKNKAS